MATAITEAARAALASAPGLPRPCGRAPPPTSAPRPVTPQPATPQR